MTINYFWEIIVLKQLYNVLKKYDFVFVTPWVEVGGSDKSTIEYAKAVKKTTYKACLLTLVRPGARIKEIPINTYNMPTKIWGWNYLNSSTKAHILFKAFIQTRVKYIQVIQSPDGFKLFNEYYQELHEHNIGLILSVFNVDYDHKTKKYSDYLSPFPKAIKNADVVLADSQYWKSYFSKLAGGCINYKKLYFPVDTHPKTKKKYSNQKSILWASRFCNQKLIDVLYKICLKMPQYKFVLYGTVSEEMPAKTFSDLLMKLPNVEYRGVYKSVNKLNIEEFDLMLFTSAFEGLSNIWTEMTNLNLPIITSAVCSYAEVFGKNYALAVKKIVDVNEYCNKIEKYYQNPKYHFDKTAKIRIKLLNFHNLRRFQKDYLGYVDDIKVKTDFKR